LKEGKGEGAIALGRESAKISADYHTGYYYKSIVLVKIEFRENWK
jgi:hypothetical protein